jgi:hypothetical protein
MVSLPASDFKAGKANHIWQVIVRIIPSDEPAMLAENACSIVCVTHPDLADFAKLFA